MPVTGPHRKNPHSLGHIHYHAARRFPNGINRESVMAQRPSTGTAPATVDAEPCSINATGFDPGRPEHGDEASVRRPADIRTSTAETACALLATDPPAGCPGSTSVSTGYTTVAVPLSSRRPQWSRCVSSQHTIVRIPVRMEIVFSCPCPVMPYCSPAWVFLR